MLPPARLAAIVAIVTALGALARTDDCSLCAVRCQKNLATCMTAAGLNRKKMSECQAVLGTCQAEDCACEQAILPLRTHLMDGCFTACRNSLYECSGGDSTVTIVLPKCAPEWSKCMATCEPPTVHETTSNSTEAPRHIASIQVRSDHKLLPPCSPDCKDDCRVAAVECEVAGGKAPSECDGHQLLCDRTCDRLCLDAFSDCNHRNETNCRACCDRVYQFCDPLDGNDLTAAEQRDCVHMKTRCHGACPELVGLAQTPSATPLSPSGNISFRDHNRPTALQLMDHVLSDMPAQVLQVVNSQADGNDDEARSQQYEQCWQSCKSSSLPCFEDLATSSRPEIGVDMGLAEKCGASVLLCTFTCADDYITSGQPRKTSTDESNAESFKHRQPVSRTENHKYPPETCDKICLDMGDVCGDSRCCDRAVFNCFGHCRLTGGEPLPNVFSACPRRQEWEIAMENSTHHETCNVTAASSVEKRCQNKQQLRCKRECMGQSWSCKFPHEDARACRERYHQCLRNCGIHIMDAVVDADKLPVSNPPSQDKAPLIEGRSHANDRTNGKPLPVSDAISPDDLEECSSKCIADPTYQACLMDKGDKVQCITALNPCMKKTCGVQFEPVKVIDTTVSGHDVPSTAKATASLLPRRPSDGMMNGRPATPAEAVCMRDCQHERWPCILRKGDGKECYDAYWTCLKRCGVVEPLISVFGVASRSGEPINALSCLSNCEAAKNTCDTLPYRKDCQQTHTICRHSCSHFDDSHNERYLRADEATCIQDCQAGKNTCDSIRPVRENCDLRHARCRKKCTARGHTASAHVNAVASMERRLSRRNSVHPREVSSCLQYCQRTLDQCRWRHKDHQALYSECDRTWQLCERVCQMQHTKEHKGRQNSGPMASNPSDNPIEERTPAEMHPEAMTSVETCIAACATVWNRCDRTFGLGTKMCRENFEGCRKECRRHPRRSATTPLSTGLMVGNKRAVSNTFATAVPVTFHQKLPHRIDTCRTGEQACLLHKRSRDKCHKTWLNCDEHYDRSDLVRRNFAQNEAPISFSDTSSAFTPGEVACRQACIEPYQRCFWGTPNSSLCWKQLQDCRWICQEEKTVKSGL